ncbi:hypothetical protein AXG55_00545 [Silvanigrella aquatica]|uniref:N-acetyltransferase domain-containing protein n=2 Tax=Silvanigrella aquatica TaxID=1915309 RepID=A0A1L4D487_9BACT|nr:hypothetical protein AXG55_00545 [Silvanigrella aquatica]
MPLKNNIMIKPLYKEDIKSHIDEMAKLRIEVFKEYPYFYDGSLSYEKEYLSNYLKSPNATVIAAFKENEMIGAATAILLSDSYEEAKAPFLKRGYNLNNIMYFGDSVIIPQFRGLGTGHRFFMHRELFALSFKNVNLITFFHVDRNKNPKYLNQKPTNYFDIESLWLSHRYAPAEGIVTTFSWKEFDEATESQKAMQFWTKKLKRF